MTSDHAAEVPEGGVQRPLTAGSTGQMASPERRTALEKSGNLPLGSGGPDDSEASVDDDFHLEDVVTITSQLPSLATDTADVQEDHEVKSEHESPQVDSVHIV